jgi:murein DD-endopeptidase MepM/ murein hydrolase activator NlpD
MHPLVRGAAAAAILSALGSFDRPKPPPEPIIVPPAMTPRPALGAAAASGTDGLPALCGPRTVPEGAVCLPVPALGTDLDVAEPLAPEASAHPTLEPGRGLEVYDHIPRRPDRPSDPLAYVYPIGSPGEPARILSGYDLDRPGQSQRRTAHAVGHGGIDIGAERGEEVRAAALENQEGEPEVAFIGELFGKTVVTSHLVREAGRMRQYAVLYGHLDHVREGLAPGDRLAPGDALGFAGDTGSPGIVHLHLEIRQVRDGVSLAAIDLRALANNAVSIPCDPRNVLLRAGAPPLVPPAPAPAP